LAAIGPGAAPMGQEPDGGTGLASGSSRTEGPQERGNGMTANNPIVDPRLLPPGHPGDHPMGGLTIVLLSGDGDGPESPHSAAPIDGNGQNTFPFGTTTTTTTTTTTAGRPPSVPEGSLVITFGGGPPPPPHGATSNGDAEQRPSSESTANGPAARPRLPPVIFTFGQNTPAGINPFAAPDVVHVRSDAVWNPPAPKKSLRQWLHARERDLGIVCDDPHCKHVRVQADVVDDLDNDEELMRLNGFSTFDALCEHRFHVGCLVQANTFNGELHPLDSEGARAALRCPQCRKQGWAAIRPV
jgi:hypothetical protein